MTTLNVEKNQRDLNFVLTRSVHERLSSINNSNDLARLIPTENLLNIDMSSNLEAFIHSSFVQEFKGKIESNERLEFLGDAVLSVIISEELYQNFPELSEGKLSKFRAALVNEDSLYELALCSKLDEFIVFGKGELSQKNLKIGPLADALEALIGCVFKNEGMQEAKNLVQKLMDNYKANFQKEFIDLKRLEEFDAKSTLQEKVMAIHQCLPEYVDRQIGEQEFEVDLIIKDKKIKTLRGNSKKRIQKQLAKIAIREELYL